MLTGGEGSRIGGDDKWPLPDDGGCTVGTTTVFTFLPATRDGPAWDGPGPCFNSLRRVARAATAPAMGLTEEPVNWPRRVGCREEDPPLRDSSSAFIASRYMSSNSFTGGGASVMSSTERLGD
jgi:hypothetical protein